jgi:Flp pilus assembly protein TadD
MTRASKILLVAFALITLISGCTSNKQKTMYGEKVNDKKLTGTTDKQKAKLLKSLDRKYENPKAHYELGKIYHSEGLLDKAEWEFNKTLAFDPMHHEAQASIVKVLKDRDDAAKAEAISEMYISQSGISAKHSLILGRAFQTRGLDDYALICFKQAHNLAPNSVVINKQLGYYYLLKKDSANAEVYLRRAFELNPNQPEIAGELGKLGVQVEVPKKKAKDTKKIDKKMDVDQVK